MANEPKLPGLARLGLGIFAILSVGICVAHTAYVLNYYFSIYFAIPIALLVGLLIAYGFGALYHSVGKDLQGVTIVEQLQSLWEHVVGRAKFYALLIGVSAVIASIFVLPVPTVEPPTRNTAQKKEPTTHETAVKPPVVIARPPTSSSTASESEPAHPLRKKGSRNVAEAEPPVDVCVLGEVFSIDDLHACLKKLRGNSKEVGGP